MKILILYETVYPDFIGGVETRNYELAAALARRGHQVTLAGFHSGPAGRSPELDPGGRLRVWSLGEIRGLYNQEGKRSTRQALRFAARVARLDLGEFDVVETPNMPYVHLLPLALRCALAGKPLVVTWYEYWGPYWKGYVGRAKAPAYRAVEWLTAQLGAAVTATSRLTEERVATARRLLRKRNVELVPCGIEVERVRRAVADGARERGEGAAPPLLYAGRLLEHKRLDLLLGAVARLAVRPEMPAGPLLTVFGEGPDRPRLGRMAAELGITERVAFRGHVATSEEVWRELGRARLAVQPSAREGFGLFPLEAMAAGLPVVYCESPESAVAELVRDGVEGIEVPADPEALAGEIAGLLADPVRYARLAAAARARAAEYDYDEIARRIEQLCEDLIARRRVRR